MSQTTFEPAPTAKGRVTALSPSHFSLISGAEEVCAADAPMIRTENLTKSYDGRNFVLRDLSLSIRNGERVALIGANGSGKTTLLKSLIGLHPISGGNIETMGERFSSRPTGPQMRRLRRRTGFVFQKHCLVRRRSVLSNVVHGMLGGQGSWRAFSQTTAPEAWRMRAMAALREVDLEHKALDRADTLSGGQQQRVAIARALIRRPSLLIADEPSASLDPAAGHDVMELFTNLCCQHGITLVFTSHDMEHATEFSDRVVALKGGKVNFDLPSSMVDAEHTENIFA